MKKNKLISILLTVLTICLLCGCGGSTQSTSTPSIYTGYDKTESINLYGVKGSGLEGATAAAAIGKVPQARGYMILQPVFPAKSEIFQTRLLQVN